MLDETLVRANELLRKLNLLERDLEDLPEHAPLRKKKQAEYDERAAEYRRLMTDIQDAQGQGRLFD
jgi:Ni,Fe-hydrogenase III large subunit